jgi:hypothetical protein
MIVVLVVKVDVKNDRMSIATHTNGMAIHAAENTVHDAICKHSSEDEFELIDVSVDKAQTVAENIL